MDSSGVLPRPLAAAPAPPALANLITATCTAYSVVVATAAAATLLEISAADQAPTTTAAETTTTNATATATATTTAATTTNANSPPVESSLYNMDFFVTAIIYGLTFLVGTIGNSLIVYSVVHFKRMKSLSNVFLASLATADLLLIIFCVPVKFIQLFSFTWTVGEFLCKSVHYIQSLTAICSVWTLTAISIERYYAIIYPVECRYIRTMFQTKIIIGCIWLASIVLALPAFWLQIRITVGDPHLEAYWCIRDWYHPIRWRIYEVYMLLNILVLPLMIMTYSYARICHKLWSVLQDRQVSFHISTRTTTNDDADSSRGTASGGCGAVYIDSSATKMTQVIRMLIVVVIIFVLCWAPILICNVLAAFDLVPKLNYGYWMILRSSANLASYANSCLNPIIYGFMSSHFRDSFKSAIFRCLGCRARHH